MLYFIVLIDYGFNLTATRKVSICNKDKNNISEILSVVITTKLYLLLFSLLIIGAIVFLIPKFHNLWLLYFYTSGILIGQFLFPTWLFQGLQKMKYLLYFNSFSKAIVTASIFIFVKKPEDFIYVNLFASLGSILVGVLSVFFVLKKYQLTLYLTNLKYVIIELKEGWMVFLSNFSIQIYLISNLIILGFFADDTTVGNYTIAEKLIMIFRIILVIASEVIYPHVCRLIETPNAIQDFFRKKIYPLLGILLVGCILLFVFSPSIIQLITNKNIAQHDRNEIVSLVKILSFVPFIVGLNIPAYQTLLALNKKNIYSAISFSGAFISICLNLILAFNYGAYGTAISILITETIITSCLIIASNKFFKQELKTSN